MLRNIIYIPQWIVDAVARSHQNLDIVLELDRLKEVVSNADLIGLAALNNSIGELLGFDINLAIGGGLTSYWQTHGGAATQEFITNAIYPNITTDTAKETLARLVKDNWEDSEDSDDFMGIDLSLDTSAIILKYGFFNVMDTDHIQFKLLEEILQILYLYHDHHLVAATPVGRKYLELLALNQ